MLGSAKSEDHRLSAIKLFSKYSNLCDHNASMSWTDKRTAMAILCLLKHHSKKQKRKKRHSNNKLTALNLMVIMTHYGMDGFTSRSAA